MGQTKLNVLNQEVLDIKDRYPWLSLDNGFIVWFLRAFIVDDEKAAVEAIKGGSRDKGVDAVYLDHEARIVFVIQGKYHQGPHVKQESRSDIIALADLGRVILLSDRGNFNKLLQDADITVKDVLEKVRNVLLKHNYRLNLLFITTGKVSQTHKEEAAQRIEDWDHASFEVYGGADLNRLMQDYIEGAAPPVPGTSLSIHGEQLFNRFDPATEISSWVFTMLGRELGELYKEIGDRLFARNIRGFLGKTDINRGMENTLKREPTYFWYFNNGVTIICDEAKQITERGHKRLRLKNAQIINGQQTTRILAKYTDPQATILVRVIVLPRDTRDDHGKYTYLVSTIVSATNWQNAISQSDLKSNDIEQVRLEREFRKYGYQYLRKHLTKSEARRITGNRYRYLVKKEDLAKSVGACLLDPYEVRLGKDRLFEDDVYPIIFNGRNAAEYLTFHWLNRRFVSYWSRGDRRLGYAKWLVLNFIWSQIGDSLRRQLLRDNFRYLAERSNSYSSEIKPFDRAIKDLFKAALSFYRAHRKTKNKVLDESSFFKLKNIDQNFLKFWRSSKNTRKCEVKKRLDLFVKNLQEFNAD